jgi:NAD(P)-dependent dehydrogenase (short-subunit alcohol dehydrogenase family)
MKTVLITGANKGIGFETARQMAGKGYRVFIAARDVVKGEEALQQLQQQGFDDIAFVQMDVTDSESIQKAYSTLASQVSSLDVLVNNAGISGAFPQHASSFPVDKVLEVFQTNFFGVIRVTQAFLPLLKLSAAPRIVNVSSGLGSLTKQSDPTSAFHAYRGIAYGPSKTALNAYTVALAYELRELPFKLNMVDPGYTATDLNNHSGHKTVEAAAKPIVHYATLGGDGPTGRFFNEQGEVPW